MLLELVVENYAVVERLRVHFHAGLNLLTGETGSGKSIVVDALGLLLGGRASAESIRTGESRARIAGIFDVRDQAAVKRLLEPAGIEPDEDTARGNERRALLKLEKLQGAASAAYEAVYENPDSALSLARTASKKVDELCRIDSSLDGLREHLKAAELSLQEAAYGLR